MVKWILFWTILLVNVLGTHLIDEIDLDDLDDEEIAKKIKMMPKKKKRPYESKIDSPTDEDVDVKEEEIALKSRDKMKGIKDINCIDFPEYATNCTVGAAMFYNTPRVTPPLPSKLKDWCKAIRHLTRCAIDWNTDCNDSTDTVFNEDSIKGHMHVLDNICDDEWFLGRYNEITPCVEEASDAWEDCYATFKLIVEEQKNITREWTHYETHFYLCCAQAQFRRCTLNFLFKMPKCPYEHAVTMQKFSVIISEGDVYQECNNNIVYANCPSGDPTPTQQQLRMLMEGSEKLAISYVDTHSVNVMLLFLCILKFIVHFSLFY